MIDNEIKIDEGYIICYLIPVYRNGIMYYMYEYFRSFSTYEEAKEFIIENNMEAICKTTIFTKYQYDQFKNKTHRGLVEFEKVKAPYLKCKDCEYLSDKKSNLGRLCVEKSYYRVSTSKWKAPSAKACKRFKKKVRII